jgi:regulator of sigma E protease
MIVTIAATLGVLGVLIVVHELGHFMAARAFDIHVSRFSIGLGPKLVAFQRGETEFRISALPLGGYVKLTGMKEMDLIEGKDDEALDIDPSRRFAAKPPAVRAIVLAAGVAMNVVFAVVVFGGIALVKGLPAPQEPVVGSVAAEWLPEGTQDLVAIPAGTRITRVGDQDVASMGEISRAIMAAPAGDLAFHFDQGEPITITIPEQAQDRQLLPVAIEPLSDAAPIVGVVKEGTAAAEAGLQSGDRVLSIDGTAVATWQGLNRIVQENPGRELALQVQRGEEILTVSLTPVTRRLGDRSMGIIGAYVDFREITMPRQRVGPVAAAAYGFTQSWDIVALMGSFAAGLVDGRNSAREMGGPILIGQISGVVSRAGFTTLLFFAGLLSINLAVMNLLPIPALDGGHLAFLAVEKVRGRPAGERAHAALGRLGFAMVLLITLWGVTADMLRIFGI